jgi:ribose transport system permease protein
MMDKLPQLSLPARILGLAIGLLLAVIGAGYGFAQGVAVQVVILSAIATLALFVFAWRYVIGQFLDPSEPAIDGPSPLRRAWVQYRWPLLGLALILLAFLVLSLTVEAFFNIWNVISLIILLAILILTRTLGRQFQQNRSAFIGIMVLAGLFSVGSMNIEGFASGGNIKSMLLFASFLGLA